MSSTSGSSKHSPVETAAVVAHGRVDVREAVERVQAVVLVKPQFEAGRADVGKGGVVRDEEVRRRVVREVAEAALSWEATVYGVVDSGLPGPKGNREIFLHLVQAEEPTLPDDLDERIEHALAG